MIIKVKTISIPQAAYQALVKITAQFQTGRLSLFKKL